MGSVSQRAGREQGCRELIASPSPRPAPPATINVKSGKEEARQKGGVVRDRLEKASEREFGTQQF